MSWTRNVAIAPSARRTAEVQLAAERDELCTVAFTQDAGVIAEVDRRVIVAQHDETVARWVYSRDHKR